eukprot:gene27482-34204_t
MCDKRNMSIEDFWQVMNEQNLVYLAAHPDNKPNDLPEPISFEELPTTFSFTVSKKEGGISFVDDPWRSLAGFSRKVTDVASSGKTCGKDDSAYCERCMYRGCEDGYQKSGRGVSFFEFRWSYFLNDATFFAPYLWDSEDQYAAFKKAYERLPVSVLPKVDTSEWLDVAELAIALCRGKAGETYSLPTELFPSDDKGNTLPGYFYGYQKLADDPSCSTPTCI